MNQPCPCSGFTILEQRQCLDVNCDITAAESPHDSLSNGGICHKAFLIAGNPGRFLDLGSITCFDANEPRSDAPGIQVDIWCLRHPTKPIGQVPFWPCRIDASISRVNLSDRVLPIGLAEMSCCGLGGRAQVHADAAIRRALRYQKYVLPHSLDDQLPMHGIV